MTEQYPLVTTSDTQSASNMLPTSCLSCESKLQQSELLKSAILDSVSDHIAVLDRQGNIIEINAPWQIYSDTNSGRETPKTGIGTNYLDTCRATLPSHPAQNVANEIEAILQDRSTAFIYEYACHSPEEKRWFQMRVTPLKRSEGGAVVAHSDITQNKRYRDQLYRMAHFDQLTGLPNRSRLHDQLQQAMTQARRQQTMLAVCYLDLDNFKQFNDEHGHRSGDRLLVALSERLSQWLSPNDYIAHVGGDEFVLILEITSQDASVPMINSLLKQVARPVQIDQQSLTTTASIGVSFFPHADMLDPEPEEDVNADQLVRQAEHELYYAKLEGKNCYHCFDPVKAQGLRTLRVEKSNIARALQNREFTVFYQPKIDLSNHQVIGAEALVRWQDSERGLLPPGEFLPAIENSPLMVKLGRQVLDMALQQSKLWKSQGLSLQISVNVDALQLNQPGFIDRLHDKLCHYGIGQGELQLEITESSALNDIAHVADIVRACEALGVSVALDDFGTGYSSLTYLKQLPAKWIKIDQSFVRDMLENPDDIAILQGILGLAKAFDRQVIAEGVETQGHGQLLRRLGCQYAQGYAIARPMPPEQFTDWLERWKNENSLPAAANA